ncbi:MAG: hypothetical protein II263_04295, partial [Lachnospiraceae bacterium]|nr:hypothetical protein [Lachnospiraceae bacterium]
FALPEATEEKELLELIGKLNADDSVNGILCQLPLPKHIDESEIVNKTCTHRNVVLSDTLCTVLAGHHFSKVYNLCICKLLIGSKLI